MDCYVLDTGDRVISLRATLKAIADKEGGNLGEYIGVQALKPFVNSDLVLAETKAERKWCDFDIGREKEENK